MQGITLTMDFTERSDGALRCTAVLVQVHRATLDTCRSWMRPPGPGRRPGLPRSLSRWTVRYRNRTDGEEGSTWFQIIWKYRSRKELECR